MTRKYWSRLMSPAVSLCVCSAFVGVLSPSPVWAQDPFGSSSDDPFASGADDPFGGSSDPFGNGQDAVTPGTRAQGNAPLTSDPLALQFLAQNFEDPVRRCVAVITLFQMGEVEVAKQVAAGFGQQPLPDAEALRLVRSVGSHNLLGLMKREELPSDRRNWFQSTMDNAMAFATSEAHVSELLDQLINGDQDQQLAVLPEIRVAGLEAASAILTEIQNRLDAGDLDDPVLRRLVAVVRKGSENWDPALRSIAVSESPWRQAAVLGLAARMSDSQNAAILISEYYREQSDATLAPILQQWKPLFASTFGISLDDREMLALWIEKQLQVQQTYLRDLGDYNQALPVWQETVWLWEPDLGNVTPVVPDRYEMPSRKAAQWAKALYQVVPNDPRIERLYLVAQLQRAKYVAGVDQPLPTSALDLVAQTTDASNLLFMLKSQLERKNTVAAQAILEVLGTTGSADLLATTHGRHSTIIHALTSSDARVRFEAAMTVLKWKPQTSFAGSTYFNNALAELLGSTIGTQVVIATANQSDGNYLHATIRSEGWDVAVAPTTQSLYEILEQQPISLLVLTDALGDEPYVSVLDRIRELPRGEMLPVALLVRPENLETAQKMFRLDRLDRYTTVGGLGGDNMQVSQFLAEASRMADQLDMPKTYKQRKSYEALELLSKWLDDKAARRILDPGKVSPVVAKLTFDPQLGYLAASLLGYHGSPTSQLELAVLAGNASQSQRTRAAAAKAFRQSVEQFGILLTSNQIRAQYDRQNQTADESNFSRDIMNSILDTLEARHKKIAFDQLPSIPEPSATTNLGS